MKIRPGRFPGGGNSEFPGGIPPPPGYMPRINCRSVGVCGIKNLSTDFNAILKVYFLHKREKCIDFDHSLQGKELVGGAIF